MQLVTLEILQHLRLGHNLLSQRLLPGDYYLLLLGGWLIVVIKFNIHCLLSLLVLVQGFVGRKIAPHVGCLVLTHAEAFYFDFAGPTLESSGSEMRNFLSKNQKDFYKLHFLKLWF